MEEIEIKKHKKKDMFLNIIIVQCIAVFLIAIAVLTAKFFFKGTYKEISEWYKDNILIDTDIKQVTDIGGDLDEI